MTVSSVYEPVQYTGNGVTTAFAFPYIFYDDTDIIVTLTLISTGANTLQVNPTDYTLTGGDGETGTVNFVAAPSALYRVTIERDIPYLQEDNYVEGQAFPAQTIETAFDRGVIRDQQINSALERTIKYPATDPNSLNGELPSAIERANKVLSFDADGEPTITSTDSDNVIAAQAAADAAEASAALAAQAAAGFKAKNSVRVATTANIATMEGALTIDGVLLVPDVDRVLVKNQSTASQNGIYTVRFSTWGRTTDADSWDELVSAMVSVDEGSTQADTTWFCSVNQGGTIGSTNVTWIPFPIIIPDGAVSTAAKIVDGIITYAKIAATAFASVAEIVAGTASKFIDAATFKTYGEQYLPRKVYSSGTISGSPATVSSGAIFRSGYNYLIKWSDVGPATDGQALTMRFLASGSPLTSANYGQNGNSIADNLGTYNSTVAASATSLLCSGASLGNLTAETSSGEILLFEPNTAKSGYVSATINARGVDTSGVPVGLLGCMGFLVAGQLVDGVQFYFPSGNFANKGKFVIEEIAI